MKQYQVEKFKRWFASYVAGFYGDDPYVNANIKLKECHSARVCLEMDYLTEQVALDANRRRIAQVIALFHDVGRFEQFKKYRTYSDTRSINHSELGVEILRREKLLDSADDGEKCLIEKAIEYHGIKQIPADLDGESRLMTKLIRDADKLDIYKVVIDYYRQYREQPDKFRLEVELPDEPRYSPDVAADILKGKRIDYARLRTWNDMKLLQMGWIYDINFVATLRRIKSRRYIEKLADFLPRTTEVEKIKETILAYLDSKIEEAE